ncbi:MAG TPA: hypothetical protein VNA89_15395 [Gemmatimonadaceae bacterium]|nr:hypothetical protein [Gemmatimonadaceae bacterium]
MLPIPGYVWATPGRHVGADSTALASAGGAVVRADAARGLADLLRGQGDSLYGLSGKLRVRLLAGNTGTFARPVMERLFGDSAAQRPGIYAVVDSALAQPLSFITLRPFAAKQAGRVGLYRVGFWPAERGRRSPGAYANPDGFIEVTPANQDTYVSEHFRLRDFLTKDQQDVWPKYLVLREELVDKLELVIEELGHDGVRVDHMVVMSGFRTPQYNARGVGRGGRAGDSRHQYGDAADVFVDNNRDGRMDDLNGDRRVDTRDATVILRAVERVESRFPQLVGGAGLYRATRAHGPFAHVDVRGTRARWGRA